VAELDSFASALERESAGASGRDQAQLMALAGTLKGLAASLR
jgi:hypothetical protein